jgi:nickel transport protein
MKPILTFLTGMVVAMAIVSEGLCHGVEGTVEPVEGYCLTAMYDDGERMSYAAVEIDAPQADIVFQTGRTDRNGRFMILPDKPGTWQAMVSDGMGHRLALDFEVSVEGDNQPKGKSADPVLTDATGRPIKTVAGLSIIFGLCGFFYGWKARHEKNGSGQQTGTQS